jgi:hypothetical protein
VLRTLKTVEPEVAQKLAYFTGFRLVPDTLNLRAGRVRDVARGEIFIHLGWLNDPWLLKGLALRRTPWIFDPRWLRRPFYYRTEANPLVTCFVLRHWKYCPPYAWYQFGHQIKAARYKLFYELCRGLWRNLETPVLCDGAVEPEPLLHFWFKLGRARRPLWSETEVRQAVTDMPVEVSSEEIAVRFTLPLLYVKEVLRPRLE